MGGGKRLSELEQGKIQGYKDSGKSYREIGKIMNRSHAVIRSYCRDKENYGKRHGGGRQSKLSERDKRRVLHAASNNVTSLSKIKCDLELPVHISTISRVLKQATSIRYEKMKKAPLHKPIHLKLRKEWAKEKLQYGDKWNKVIFSDEKKFNLDGPDGFAHYWHDLRKEKLIQTKRAMGGGGVMIWAAIGYHGRTLVHCINGTLDSEKYQLILEKELVPNGVKIGGRGWMFQQDNARPHVSRSSQDFFRRKKMRVLDWPAYSPDLNPMENMFGILCRKVYDGGARHFDNLGDLIEAIKDAWKAIPLQTLRNLIESMPGRVAKVYALNGAFLTTDKIST